MANIPQVKMGIVGVSRDCFPRELAQRRLNAVAKAYKDAGLKLTKAATIIEKETDALEVVAEFRAAGVNAAVIYLGNFGPEGPMTIFAKEFGGPVMLLAAAEETGENLINGRGDAYCGMLNACYNFGLRHVPVHVPELPVCLPDKAPCKISHFFKIARVILGLRGLKIFTFGPRPQDFLACNAPIKPLFDLGVEIMENSELDMFQAFQKHAGDKRIGRVAKAMEAELAGTSPQPSLLVKLAQFELTLRDFMCDNLGSRQFGVFADKCWPAFESGFGFVPCYVNSRLAADGIPVACEVDIYGALSEYICTLATEAPATLLDINNTVPPDMIKKNADLKGASPADLFMGFHCGNTPACCMKNCSLKYQLIMHRLMEPGKEPDITRGTLEGQLRPGAATIFRLQSTAGCDLKSYIAEGEILDINPRSFGGIGVFAIPGMARFYRHVLLQKRYPHHTAVAFVKTGRALFDAMKMLGIPDIAAPKPAGVLYETENPFGAHE